MTVVNQQRIAKNTLLLYVRMVIAMLVGLYTSRVIIDSLGQEHYGVYDAVGGIVLMASFVSSTMSGACQRYYSYELGRGNIERLKLVFSTSLTVFCILAVLILILAETVGNWFLYNKMDVGGHIRAASWVFQFSIIAFLLTILRSPYQGMIVSKEKMKVFAYLSLFESFATLATAIAIAHTYDNKDNRLILYSGLMAGIQLISSTFYWVYCRVFYSECKFRLKIDKPTFKDMFSYAGWHMIGSCSDVFERYGLNILLNIKFGPIVSAARGVANKVYVTISQLNTNFFTAVKPQIYKSYAAGDKKDMHKLVCQSTRFTFFLLLLLALPILIETDFILPIWLRGRNVPELAGILTQLMVIEGLINSFTEPLAAAVQATGIIRNYKIVIGGTFLMILPLSYIGITFFGLPPYSAFVISIIMSVITQVERLWFVKKIAKMDMRNYFKTVIIPVFVVAIISFSSAYAVKYWMHHTSFSLPWIGNVIVILASMLIVCITFYAFGMTKTERKHSIEMALYFLKLKKRDNVD